MSGENEVGFSNEPVGQALRDLQAKDKANGNKFYMPKEITKTNSSPTDWDQHPGSEKSSIDIIPHQFLKNNPVSSQPQSIQPVPPPESRENWLERLKRERRKRGWF